MKGGLAILLGGKMPKLGKGSSKDVESKEESDSEESGASKKEYAQGILDAIADEDAEALAEALTGFQECE